MNFSCQIIVWRLGDIVLISVLLETNKHVNLSSLRATVFSAAWIMAQWHVGLAEHARVYFGLAVLYSKCHSIQFSQADGLCQDKHHSHESLKTNREASEIAKINNKCSENI